MPSSSSPVEFYKKKAYHGAMPSRHRYKCQNQQCRIYRTEIFEAMNAPTPECPVCGSVQLEDWGEPVNIMLGLNEAKRVDGELNRIAEQNGVTDIKSRHVSEPSSPAYSGPTASIGGVDVPVSAAVSGACLNVPQLARPLTGTWTGAATSSALSDRTNVKYSDGESA